MLASIENLRLGSGAHLCEVDSVPQGQDRKRALEIRVLEMEGRGPSIKDEPVWTDGYCPGAQLGLGGGTENSNIKGYDFQNKKKSNIGKHMVVLQKNKQNYRLI